MTFNLIFGIFIIALVFLTNTIITKKWRDKAINESQSWKWGIFYYNPLDKRIFLPKRYGLGYTLNFAQPASIIIVFAVFAIIIISMIYSHKKVTYHETQNFIYPRLISFSNNDKLQKIRNASRPALYQRYFN
jgi:predicted RND superfamily exporter protein